MLRGREEVATDPYSSDEHRYSFSSITEATLNPAATGAGVVTWRRRAEVRARPRRGGAINCVRGD
jgi:hypothetical protein